MFLSRELTVQRIRLLFALAWTESSSEPILCPGKFTAHKRPQQLLYVPLSHSVCKPTLGSDLCRGGEVTEAGALRSGSEQELATRTGLTPNRPPQLPGGTRPPSQNAGLWTWLLSCQHSVLRGVGRGAEPCCGRRTAAAPEEAPPEPPARRHSRHFLSRPPRPLGARPQPAAGNAARGGAPGHGAQQRTGRSRAKPSRAPGTSTRR